MAIVAKASSESYARAAKILADGGVVALPTETVYGLAGDARNDESVAKIYAIKGRPAHNPLIAHVLKPEDASDYAEISPLAQRLITAFWPGPLTLVLPKRGQQLSILAGVRLDTIALRCPDIAWTRIIRESDFPGPLFMPSANISGRISPTLATHVADDLGDKVDLIIDNGPCPGGIESTVLKIEGDKATMLRPGAIPMDALIPFTDAVLIPDNEAPISAPGMLASHYAPNAKLRLNVKTPRPGEPYLAFGPTDFEVDDNLSSSGDLTEAARNLYAALRRLDISDSIAVASVPETGLGIAINDRLRRAAAPR